MSKIWIFNDWHVGVRRSGGTTPYTAHSLRVWMRDQAAHCLSLPQQGDTVIFNGDLTDKFDIDLSDAWQLLQQLREMVVERGVKLYLAVGNHDLSKDSNKLGIVQFLGSALHSFQPDGPSMLIEEPTLLEGGLYVIPHMVNQALFDQALEWVPAGVTFLLLHCNYDSPFAEHADHSLNLSLGQAQRLRDAGVTMILGHEHHSRTALDGAVQIIGNQFPSSVADCFTPDGRLVEAKQCCVISQGEIRKLRTWEHDAERGGACQISVSTLLESGLTGLDLSALQGFVRVTGEVLPEQAAEALRLISRLRQSCNAFVIANAVRVRATADEIEDLMEQIEDVREVNVLEMLMEILTPEQQEAVRAVLAIRE